MLDRFGRALCPFRIPCGTIHAWFERHTGGGLGGCALEPCDPTDTLGRVRIDGQAGAWRSMANGLRAILTRPSVSPPVPVSGSRLTARLDR
jgi:hypothetical protein